MSAAISAAKRAELPAFVRFPSAEHGNDEHRRRHTLRVGTHPFVVRNAFGDLRVGEFQGSRLWPLRP
jgi:hypothetical protein